ncbi:hypothetical protein ACFLQN_00585 [Candidatus Aenigmatarchaeota archaeon]
MKDIKLRELGDKIVLITFPSKKQLCNTFMRFQEFYESSDWRGRVFTKQEFEEWYSEGGKHSYHDDWEGFNIPSWVIEPFIEGVFDPLSEEEKAFLKLFKSKTGMFYIIGTCHDSDDELLSHEISHAMFYVNTNYRKEVVETLKGMNGDVLESIEKMLENDEYHPAVWQDEVHAYVLSHLNVLEKSGVDIKRLKEINEKLNEIYERHYRGLDIPQLS